MRARGVIAVKLICESPEFYFEFNFPVTKRNPPMARAAIKMAPSKYIVRLYQRKLPPGFVALLKKEYEHQHTRAIKTIVRMVANLIYAALSRRPLADFKRALLPMALAGAAIVEVEGALFLQKGEIAENVLFHFLWLRFRIDLLQLGNDLLDGVFAVAALDNFEARAVQTQRALGHEQNALLIIFSQTATGSEAGTAIQFKWHRKFFRIPLRAGKLPGAASLDSRMQNRARQAEPRGCHIWLATPHEPNPDPRGRARV